MLRLFCARFLSEHSAEEFERKAINLRNRQGHSTSFKREWSVSTNVLQCNGKCPVPFDAELRCARRTVGKVKEIESVRRPGISSFQRPAKLNRDLLFLSEIHAQRIPKWPSPVPNGDQ